MKIRIYPIIAALLLVIANSSCKKILEQEPLYLLTPEAAVVDEKSAQAILNGAYSFIGKDEWTVRFTGGFTAMLGTVNYNAAAANFNMTATGDNNALWPAFYKTINAANAAIEAITLLPEGAFKVTSRKDEMIAEARVIRAFAHFYTFLYFGRWWDEPGSEYGILYRDKISDLSNIYQERLSVGESYEKIIEDLDYGIQKAPNYTNCKRVSKQLAEALKAKLFLYRGRGTDYIDALALVNNVINKAGNYGLQLEPSLTSLYNNSWDSKELLFCRYREQTDDVVSAYNYTYGYNFAMLTANPMAKSLLEGDPRYMEAWGLIRSPITNNNTYALAAKKLARKGRQEGGDNDKYTTYFLRLTELYFMKAELLQKTQGSLVEAIEQINIIRRRSNLSDTTVTTEIEFNKLLFRELFIELHMENEADWMAALRLKDADGKPMIYGLRGPAVDIVEDRFIYPIPTVEMKYNRKMKQNPSYEHLQY